MASSRCACASWTASRHQRSLQQATVPAYRSFTLLKRFNFSKWSNRRCSSLKLRKSTATNAARNSHDDPLGLMNKVLTSSLRAMLAADEAAARIAAQEVVSLQARLLAQQESQAAQFLAVLHAILEHRLEGSMVEGLDGEYLAALNRVMNQLHGSEWRVGMEESTLGSNETKFSTWEDVIGNKKAQQAQQQQQQEGSKAGAGGESRQEGGSSRGRLKGQPVDDSYYRTLHLAPSATLKEVKAAYRKLALQLHPDVNDAPDADQAFAKLALAYDTLSDDAARRLYDQYGPEGMRRHAGARAGQGNAGRMWEEFKPFKRENKRTRARDATRAAHAHAHGRSSSAGGTPSSQLPQPPACGELVEYPLGDVVKAELGDGRSHGVGLLVARNMDRGDVQRLPADALDRCEVEALRQEEPGSNRWIPDELSPPAFCRLEELRRLPVADYDSRFDVWLITEPLSEGCGGPDLPEEIIV